MSSSKLSKSLSRPLTSRGLHLPSEYLFSSVSATKAFAPLVADYETLLSGPLDGRSVFAYPSILKVGDRHLLAFRAGTNGGEATPYDGDLYFAWSDNYFKTIYNVRKVIDSSEDLPANTNVLSAELHFDMDGRVACAVQLAEQVTDVGDRGKWTTIYRSNNGGASLNLASDFEVFDLATTGLGNVYSYVSQHGPIVTMPDGDQIMTAWGHDTDDYDPWGTFTMKSYCFRRPNAGSWSKTPILIDATAEKSNEASLLLTGGDNVRALVRNRNTEFRYVDSTDGGETWGASTLANEVSGWERTSTKHVALESGAVLTLMRRLTSTEWGFMVSRDNGANWTPYHTVDGGPDDNQRTFYWSMLAENGAAYGVGTSGTASDMKLKRIVIREGTLVDGSDKHDGTDPVLSGPVRMIPSGMNGAIYGEWNNVGTVDPGFATSANLPMKESGAISFSGVDDHVELGSTPANWNFLHDDTVPWIIAMRIKVADNSANNRILGTNYTSAENGVFMNADDSGGAGGTKTLEFHMTRKVAATYQYQFVVDNRYTPGEWLSLVIFYDKRLDRVFCFTDDAQPFSTGRLNATNTDDAKNALCIGRHHPTIGGEGEFDLSHLAIISGADATFKNASKISAWLHAQTWSPTFDPATNPAALIIPDSANAATVTMDDLNTSNEVIHTAPLHIPGGWGPDGHAYWLGVTPYPGFDDQRENPSLLSSADGATWVEPTGMTNPIEGPPGGGDYNADIDLYFDADAGRLHVFWTQINDDASQGEYLWRHASSTNGTDWDGTNGSEAPSTVKTGTTVADAVSPSVVKRIEGATTFGAWAVDVSTVPSGPYSVDFYESNDLKSWSNAHSTVTLAGKLPSTHRPWHVWVKEQGGKYVMILAAQPKETYTGADTGAGADISLWAGVSTDPLNFDLFLLGSRNWDTIGNHWASDALYRSGMFLGGSQQGKIAISGYDALVPRFAISPATPIAPTMPAWDWAIDTTGAYATTIDVDGSNNVTGITPYGGVAETAFLSGTGAEMKLEADGVRVKNKSIYWVTAGFEQLTMAVIYKMNEATADANPEFVARANALGLIQFNGLTQCGYYAPTLGGGNYTGSNSSNMRYIQSEWRLAVLSYDGTTLRMVHGVKGDNAHSTETLESGLTDRLGSNVVRALGAPNVYNGDYPNDCTIQGLYVLESGSTEQELHEIFHALQSTIPSA